MSVNRETFKAGDTVKLKSGGPVMTVQTADDLESVWCQWFVEGKRLETGAFPAASLIKAQPGQLPSGGA